MMALRLLTIAILAFLLLDPVVSSQFRKIEKPTILVALDKSSSLTFSHDSLELNKHEQQLNELTQRLGESYDVKTYSFGSQVIEGFSDQYDQKETDFSALLREMEERHFNRNIGAFIMVSDGIYNKGANPLYSKHNFNFPLFTIAVGDTSKKKDVILKKASHNDIAYLGNQFPVNIDISAYGSKGEVVTTTIYQNGKKLASKNTAILSNSESTTAKFLLEATKIGMQSFRIEVSSVPNESNTTNNSASIFIEVLDSRQKILILANSPHPDIGAMKSSLLAFDNYQVDNELAQQFTGNIDGYDLVILHQLPSKKQPVALINKIVESNVSCLYILGHQTNISGFNLHNTGLKITGNIRKLNEARAVYEKDFSLFTLPSAFIENISKLPPLHSPFGEYSMSNDHTNFLNQRIGLVESGNPLITFTKIENKKIGVICGDGIWRWKTWSYQETQRHDNFNEFIGKIVQYLSVKEDKSRFRVSSKNIFYENEAIVIDAELYNDSYELINDAEIGITIVDEQGKEFPYVFNRTTSAYTLNVGTLPVGQYSYQAFVKGGDQTLSKKGSFNVTPILIESINTIANHELLFKLSQKYNGDLFHMSELEALEKMIAENEEIRPVSYTEDKPLELIHLKWVFFLLITLLAAEWYMRKRNGAFLILGIFPNVHKNK